MFSMWATIVHLLGCHSSKEHKLRPTLSLTPVPILDEEFSFLFNFLAATEVWR